MYVCMCDCLTANIQRATVAVRKSMYVHTTSHNHSHECICTLQLASRISLAVCVCVCPLANVKFRRV